MGKRLFGFTKGETTYSFRLFPIGGYCAMEGEDEAGGNPRLSKDDDSEDNGEDAGADSVVLAGEAGQENAEITPVEGVNSGSLDEPVDDPRSFYNAKIWKRMIIIIAGAVMNILLGIVLMFITLIPKDSFVSTQVSMFSPCSFSSVTGLQPGDKIVNINGYAVNTSTDFSFALFTLPVSEVDGTELAIFKEDCVFDLYDFARSNITESTTNEANSEAVSLIQQEQKELADAADKEAAYKIFCKYYDKVAEKLNVEVKEYPDVVDGRATRVRYRTDMTVIRNGERVELKDVDLLTTVSAESDDPQINIDFYVEPMEKNFGTMITQSFAETVSTVRMVWGSVIGLVTGRFSINEMSGPIGIASAITDVASESLRTSGFGSAVNSIIYIMAVITINLGVVNMLPFPALDGGRFLMLLIEAIFKKPIPRKAERIINTVGLVLLLGLSAVIAVKDVIKIIVGG